MDCSSSRQQRGQGVAVFLRTAVLCPFNESQLRRTASFTLWPSRVSRSSTHPVKHQPGHPSIARSCIIATMQQRTALSAMQCLIQPLTRSPWIRPNESSAARLRHFDHQRSNHCLHSFFSSVSSRRPSASTERTAVSDPSMILYGQ